MKTTPAPASPHERGSIIVYILIAIFLTGLLVAAMTNGAKKSASSEQVNELMLYLDRDISAIQAAAAECAESYPAVDINGDGATDTSDNPNPRFPLYCADASCALSTMTSAGTGTPVANIGCPGAPDGNRFLFKNGNNGGFKVLGDTATYTATYYSDTTEGVYFRISRAGGNAIWSEALSRLNDKYSKCAAAYVTSNPDPTGFDCTNGCLYYWVLRQSSSSTSFETGCP